MSEEIFIRQLSMQMEELMFEDYRYYLHDKYRFDKGSWLAIGLAIWTIGGFLGFIYESVFYYANSDYQYFFWPGSTFGPWLDVSCIAALLIFLILYPLRRQPWFVFLFSALGCSAIQLLIGLVLYNFCGGLRIWNYNLEILNFGSIGGFVCLRSALAFGILGLLVIYVIAPLIFRMGVYTRRNTFVTIWLIIGLVCVLDVVYNDVVCSLVPSLPGAANLYQACGLKTLHY